MDAQLNTKTATTTVTCSKCKKESERTYYVIANVADAPEVKKLGTSGNLFLWRCPHCNTEFLSPYNLLYIDESKEYVIYFDKEYAKEFVSLLELIEEQLPKFNLRILKEPYKMEELARILDFGLNDKVVEVVKTLTAFQVQSQFNKQIANFKFIYYSDIRNELDFACAFLPDADQEENYFVSKESYDQIAQLLKEYTDERGSFEIVDVNWAVDVVAKNFGGN